MTASARFTLIWRAVSLSLPTLWNERQHDDALAADDLEAAPRRRPSGVARPRPDQGLVRAGDLVAAAEVREQQDDDDDREEDDDHARRR